MATNSFRIIGIRAVYPHIDEFPENSPRHYEKVEAIQKVLYNTDKWYYFYKGISISENNFQVVMTSEAKKDFSLYDAKGLKISLCAVVGKMVQEKAALLSYLCVPSIILQPHCLVKDITFRQQSIYIS